MSIKKQRRVYPTKMKKQAYQNEKLSLDSCILKWRTMVHHRPNAEYETKAHTPQSSDKE